MTNKINFRVGFGYDVHVFAENRDLWIGGIKIEHSVGLLGHSDADVLIHALCDAILGAANLRDIGYHFPDTSKDFKNIDSKILLAQTMELLRNKGYEILTWYRDWETDRKSTRLNSNHRSLSRMPSSA